MKTYKYFLLALLVIVIDQTSKLLIHHYMYLGEEITLVGNEVHGFKLHYLLNPGMAFGIKWENEYGKLTLTLFRIIAMIGIAYYLMKMASRNVHAGFLYCMGLILGGAIGNVIDSTFYGVFLHNSPMNAPTPWFHGQVIDMLFFPLFGFNWPEWIPFIGGGNFLFFSPVFNIADSSIFIGVLIILLYQKKFFPSKHYEESPTTYNPIPGEDVPAVADDGLPVENSAGENSETENPEKTSL